MLKAIPEPDLFKTTSPIQCKIIFLCSLLLSSNQALHCQQICSGKTSLLIENVTADNRPYQLVFADEFSGTSIDTAVWTPGEGVLRHIETTRYWLTAQNLLLENGILKIRAQRDTFLNRCFDVWMDTAMQKFCNDFYFSAGEIRTKEKFSHGLFEIRCKLPRGKGITFAFWTFGHEHNEIDVFEFRNERNMFGKIKENKLSAVQRTNIRTDYENDQRIEDCPARSPAKDLSTDFHTYSVQWTPQKVVWRVDNEVVRISTLFYSVTGQMLDQSIPAGTPVIVNRAFPRHPMEIYVNLALESGKNAPESADPFPQFYEVDYVRYYRRL